ncbi:MAG TPA: acetolactate synthase large subunit [Blastocatellia bacterium]|nr:acetolactate synthase large subunit [Blastocatellia bacterium]
MNGAESLIRTLVDAGVNVCFANPGTTEMPMVRAIDEMAGMRAVLCLFEGVCTGAADGYARMAEKPGLTLLHLGPGFANGIAYLHDARRARSPIINLIGEHATWHLAADPPLNSDIESLARPVSAWVRRNKSAEELSGDVAEAIETASIKPGQIASLIIPHDCQMDAVSGPAPVRPIPPPPKVGEDAIKQAVGALLGDESTVLFLGGYALRERGLKAAARIAEATGCKLMCETFPARWERGAGTPVIERLPYFPEQALAAISPYKSVVLAGARSPVSFFGYPGAPSYFISPQQRQTTLATPDDDVVDALESLADALGAPMNIDQNSILQTPPNPEGKITPQALSAAVAALAPENAIVMDESTTSMAPFLTMSQSAARHTLLTQPGGAIGLGPPCATGAAIACPDRVVINLQADGSAMYTLQALWTQAREQLSVKTIILNNRSYRILGVELMRAGAKEIGKQAQSLIGLTRPAIDWVSLAKGMGVPGVRVETAEDLTRELERALAEPGPQLIEAIL